MTRTFLLYVLALAMARADDALPRTARNFLAALSPEQAAKAVIPFDDDERFNWHFIPRERRGLPLHQMTATQKHLAHAVMAACLSRSGYLKATTIMSLEEVLKVLENDSGERRHPEKYYFTIFGQPDDSKPWGVRVEGHHLSINLAIVGDRVASSPTFLGANPAEVRQGPRRGLRALAPEEDKARALLESLDEGQRRAAIVSAAAPADILTEASRKAALDGQPSGLSASRLTAGQRSLFQALLEEYARNVPEQMAEHRLGQIRRAGANIWFAWAGPTGRGAPHYYRVQTAEFLIEYDNTQNNANHIHSVWRDFRDDFGVDLLAQHYRRARRDRAHGHSLR